MAPVKRISRAIVIHVERAFAGSKENAGSKRIGIDRYHCHRNTASEREGRHKLDVPPAGLGVVRASVVFSVLAGLALARQAVGGAVRVGLDRKSTRLNSSHR